jgi:hypothetical protein
VFSSLPLGFTQLRSRELRNGTAMSGAPLPHTIWLEDFGFLRIFADPFLVRAALIVPPTPSACWFALLTTAGLWYYLARDIVTLG